MLQYQRIITRVAAIPPNHFVNVAVVVERINLGKAFLTVDFGRMSTGDYCLPPHDEPAKSAQASESMFLFLKF